MSPTKILFAAAFAPILASLASAWIFILKDKGTTRRPVKSPALRVGPSIALFVAILPGWALNIIHPHGLT